MIFNHFFDPRYLFETLIGMRNTALIIDDDRTERRRVSRILKSSLNLALIEAENGKDGLHLLHQHPHIKLVILDLNMPVMGGHEALKQLSRDYPHIPVIVLTGNDHVQDAVSVMKNGAFDFLTKPITEERLGVCARNGLKLALMSNEIFRLKRKDEDAMHFSDLIGYDTGLRESVLIAQKASLSNIPALITGDTGTGKEMFARAIHGQSSRASGPFIAINCGAIPEKLVESTLFGHEKGAFTGALQKTPGKFQEANGGTLFLDEVGELPLEAQVRLLRVLQQKEVEPIGAGKAIKVDVRIISATHRDLARDIKDGRFREDLYFRLNILQIKIPPLQKRPMDIRALSESFIESFCVSHQCEPKCLSEKALQRLEAYHWPGNVRELENMINRAMVFCDHNIIEEDDLVFESPPDQANQALPDGIITTLHDDGRFKSFKELELEIITQALRHHDQNATQTARSLGIAKSTLYAKKP